MKCSKCGSDNLRVMDTFSYLDEEVYRRRKCLDCGELIYTVEYEVEFNDEFHKTYKQLCHMKNASRAKKTGKPKRENRPKKSNRYGPVVIFRKNEF